MNYLAHAFLSGDDPELLVGNMAADSLKGKLPSGLNPNVIRGIRLHHKIDRLTDNSTEFSACKAVFSPEYGRYAHVIVDIAFDHLLIGNWGKYSKCEFRSFVENVYEVLRTKRSVLPVAFIPVADRICSHDWFNSYRSLTGLATAYERVGHRLGGDKVHLEKATVLIEQERDFLSGQFNSLFPKLIELSNSFIAGEKK